jgi:hypothetical protein
VLNPFLVVLPRTCSFDGFPGENVADGVVPKAFQAREVNMGIFFAKWSGVELDIIAVEEVIDNMGGYVWITWELRVGCDIDTSQEDMSPVFVAELAILDGQAKRSHGLAWYGCIDDA